MSKSKKRAERIPSFPASRSARPDKLTAAKYERYAKVHLAFADGLSGSWSFGELQLDMSGMKVTTIRASASGKSMEVTSKWKDEVEIDATSLRAMVDSAFEAELEKRYIALRGPIDEIVVTARKR